MWIDKSYWETKKRVQFFLPHMVECQRQGKALNTRTHICPEEQPITAAFLELLHFKNWLKSIPSDGRVVSFWANVEYGLLYRIVSPPPPASVFLSCTVMYRVVPFRGSREAARACPVDVESSSACMRHVRLPSWHAASLLTIQQQHAGIYPDPPGGL